MKKIMFFAFALAVLAGCKSVEYVPVEKVHEIHHNHTDSIHTTDSIIRETTTTIMQLDSVGMARYGIQLKAAEHAWLVKTEELERQLQRLAETHTDTVHETDSVPVPYPVPKYIDKPLTWWQKTRMHAGEVTMLMLLASLGYVLILRRK